MIKVSLKSKFLFSNLKNYSQLLKTQSNVNRFCQTLKGFNLIDIRKYPNIGSNVKND